MAAPAQPDDQVLLVGKRPGQVDVLRSEAAIAKARSHGFRGSGHVAGRSIRGIDLNELLENIAGNLVFRGEAALLGTGRQAKEHKRARERENGIFHQ
jgi:hypothetical protein